METPTDLTPLMPNPTSDEPGAECPTCGHAARGFRPFWPFKRVLCATVAIADDGFESEIRCMCPHDVHSHEVVSWYEGQLAN